VSTRLRRIIPICRELRIREDGLAYTARVPVYHFRA
jgi:hypothetical protein